MNEIKIKDIIIASIHSIKPNIQDSLNDHTILYGKDGIFSSLQTINFILELEERLSEATNKNIIIDNNKMFSYKKSPLSSIILLQEFIKEQVI